MMSQRASGYARVPFDEYPTPEWATLALAPHIPRRIKHIWEPACGAGQMVKALAGAGYSVRGTDIQGGSDFFATVVGDENAVVTNPPYAIATDFIAHALHLTQPHAGFVAMLLRTDFDHAKRRRNLFDTHPAFCKKLVLTKRIQWFEDSKSQPSFNHAWFCWDWLNQGPPEIAYDFQD